MRRVVLILLALTLAPSAATASWYQCMYDGITRSACCCPGSPRQHKQKVPGQDGSVQSACCCKITQVASTVPTTRASEATSFDITPLVLAVEGTLVPERSSGGLASIDRPRAQGDPPDTLFARRCLLLL